MLLRKLNRSFLLLLFMLIYYISYTSEVTANSTLNPNNSSLTTSVTKEPNFCISSSSARNRGKRGLGFWDKKNSYELMMQQSYNQKRINFNEYGGPPNCQLSKPDQMCHSWKVVSIIQLENDTFAKSYLEEIKNFLSNVTSSCEAKSKQILITPKIACSDYGYGTQDQINAFNNLKPEDTFPLNNVNSGDSFYKLLANNTATCSDAGPLSQSEGGVVFIFLSSYCNELCKSQLLANNSLSEIFNKFIANGYLIRFMFMDGGDNKENTNCLTELVKNECDSVIYNGSCQFNLYGGPHHEALSECVRGSMTCYWSKPNVDINRIATLALAIGIPAIAITTIVLAVIMYFCCCRGCCYLAIKNQHLKNDPESGNGKKKSSKKEQRAHWLKKSGKLSRGSLVESNQNFESNPFKTVGRDFAAMNHYMDITKLAEANKCDVWEILPKNLIIHDNIILGNGAFANVYKGTLIGKVPLLVVNQGLGLALESDKLNEVEAAVKRLPAHADESNKLDFFHEIEFMKRLGYHTHIISMLGCISNPYDPMIVVEYCSRGDMLKFLRNHRDYLLMDKDDTCPIQADMCIRVKDLVSFAWQVSDGMNYLSSKSFIHRDLAARNILLNKNLVAKISDFGLCRYVDSALYTAKGGRLPIKWMSIESLKFYEYSSASDVWSFGVLLFEIFSMGDGPYPAIQPLDMIKYLEAGNRPEQPETCPNEIYDVMQRCWRANKDERPTFAELRGELAILLNLDDEHYGYIQVNNLESKAMKDMIHQEVHLKEELSQTREFTYRKTRTSAASPIGHATTSFSSDSSTVNEGAFTSCKDLAEFTGTLTDEEQKLFEKLLHKKFGPETMRELEEIVKQSPTIGKAMKKYVDSRDKQGNDDNGSPNSIDENQLENAINGEHENKETVSNTEFQASARL